MTELAIHQHAGGPLRTGIHFSLLHEIAERLDHFVKTGEPYKIDLKSMPLTPTDLEDMDKILGIGEVRADLAVIGKSEAWETSFAGVWRVRHFGTGESPVANEIVIAQVPDIIPSQPDDVAEAAGKIRKAIDGLDIEPSREDPAHV